MPGIGKYKKGAKFTLRSGNKPAFRNMGSSPIKRADVEIDGVNIGTGPEARAKAIDLQIKQAADVIKQSKESGGTADTSKHKKVTYTDKDKEVMESEKGRAEYWKGERRKDPSLPKTEEEYNKQRDAKRVKTAKKSPVEGKMWDALKKGEFKKAGRTLKNEAKARYEGFQATAGAYSTKSARQSAKMAYKQEKSRQKEAKEARKRAKRGEGSMKELDASTQTKQQNTPVPTKKENIANVSTVKKLAREKKAKEAAKVKKTLVKSKKPSTRFTRMH